MTKRNYWMVVNKNDNPVTVGEFAMAAKTKRQAECDLKDLRHHGIKTRGLRIAKVTIDVIPG